MQQKEALDWMKMGHNIFLTGPPGSGKTFLLNHYIRYLRNAEVRVAVTASTGIAATHLHGVTIHAWSGIGIKEAITEKDLEKLRETKFIKHNYENTKVLIIDEISMLHKEQLDMVDVIARYILNSVEPFGGIQVIVCGDFFQLPPVSRDPLTLEKPFAFEAAVWEKGKFQVCYLSEQHRQGKDPLLTILEDIRNATTGEHTKVPLRTRYKKEPLGATKATRLYARNIHVDAINTRELDTICSEEKTFAMQSSGIPALVKSLQKSCLAPETLVLKIGAEVMFVKNHMEGHYVNGTRGIVVAFEDSEEAYPIVKTFDHRKIIAGPAEWAYEDMGAVRATIKQIPLRLAWAITIHKSQGMTLDTAEIDLSDAFEPGMGYVALSRVRSLNGLKLMGLNATALEVHPAILEKDKDFQKSSELALYSLKTLSESEKTQLQHKTLRDRFGGRSRTAKNTGRQQKLPNYKGTLKMLQQKLSLESIAKKTGFLIGTIIRHIEKLQRLEQLDYSDIAHLKNAISEKDFECIFSALSSSEGGRLKPVYEKFEGKYLYKDLKIVSFFLKYANP
jgi:ATP-dependent DNA helicase PIF1